MPSTSSAWAYLSDLTIGERLAGELMMNIRQQRRNFHHISGSQRLKQVTFPFSTEAYQSGDARQHDVYRVA